ncbi:MAG: FecR domain-containing protein [Bacteroidota bacterium]
MNQDIYLTLLYKSLTGELTAAEQQQLDAWLAESPQHRVIQEEIARSYEIERSYEPAIEIDVQADYQKLQNRIRRTQQKPAKVRKLRPLRRYLAIAASLLLLVGAAWWLRPGEAVAPTLLSVVTEADERREVILPDGSSVWLNQNSTLRYPTTFATAERKVDLRGEAYFTVQANPAQPFKIKAQYGVEVEVLGTEFNLSTRNNAHLSLQVDEGKVAMRHLATQSEQVIPAGQATTWDIAIQNFDPTPVSSNRNAWQTGDLRFEATPLSAALTDAERLFDVRFIMTNAPLNECTITAFLPQVTPEQFLSSLQNAFGITWTKVDDTYQLRGGNCQ